jgi:hypothetical protein
MMQENMFETNVETYNDVSFDHYVEDLVENDAIDHQEAMFLQGYNDI